MVVTHVLGVVVFHYPHFSLFMHLSLSVVLSGIWFSESSFEVLFTLIYSQEREFLLFFVVQSLSALWPRTASQQTIFVLTGDPDYTAPQLPYPNYFAPLTFVLSAKSINGRVGVCWGFFLLSGLLTCILNAVQQGASPAEVFNSLNSCCSSAFTFSGLLATISVSRVFSMWCIGFVFL